MLKILSSFAAIQELVGTGWVLFALSLYSWRMESMLSVWPCFHWLCDSELCAILIDFPLEQTHHWMSKYPSKQDCILVGCIPPACWPYLPEFTAQGGACSKGSLVPGGACSLVGCLVLGEGCLLWIRCLVRGGGVWYPTMHWGRPPCEQNDRQVRKYYLARNFVCGR